MANFFLLLLFGYLIGSVSPGYFFGRLAKGIDIRKYGSGETGATNTYRVVGPAFGVIAGVLDALKALFIYYIAVSGFDFLSFQGLSPDLAILPGLAAVFGHNYPFYLKFRGGRGAAALFGLNLVALYYVRSFWTLFLLAGSLVYSVIISEEREKVWSSPPGRLTAKLSALVLPLGFIWFSKEIALIAAVLLSASLFFDVVRLLAPKINFWYLKSKKFAKDKESRRFSGYTLFLLSAFLLFGFFPKDIAVISLVFFIVGDVLAPAGQLRYMPRQPVLGDKTLGGAMVIFIFSVIAGLFIQSLTNLTVSGRIIILGGFLTAVFDQFSIFIDDNLLVPLGTAAVLTLLF